MSARSVVFGLLAGLVLAGAPARAQLVLDTDVATRWAIEGGGALSTLRLLDEDAHLVDSPSTGMLFRLGSQVVPVSLSDGRETLLGRSNLTLSMGFQFAKLLIVADTTRLSNDLFPHSKSYEIAAREQVLVAVPITLTPDISLTPAMRYDLQEIENGRIDDGDTLNLTYLMRARLGPLSGIVLFGKDWAPTFQLGFSPFLFLDLIAPDLGALLLAGLGNPEVLFHRYQPGHSPYRLIASAAPLEDNYGLKWETPDFLIPRGIASATVLAAPLASGLTWRRLEVTWNQTIKLLDFRLLGAMSSNNCLMLMCNPLAGFMWIFGFGAPGATVLVLNASGFAVNMDDAPRWGFSASVRLQLISNNKRLKSDAKVNPLLLLHEGESERVNLYLEGRVSRNDFASLRGLPFPDVTTFGVWFGSENLEFDPRTPGIARAQRDALNELLDDNPNFRPDERRKESWQGLQTELRHPVPGTEKPRKPDQRFY